MNGQHVGYIRVSSTDQNTSRQLAGLELDKFFTEKASAKDVNRPILQECLSYLRQGDTLHVHSIDRLCRNLINCQQIVDDLTEQGISIQFHKENLTFSGEADPMSKLMLQMMGAFAEFERNLIRERQKEGILAARKAGKQIGRKKALSPDQVKEIRARAAKGENKSALAKEYGVSRQTVYTVL